MRSAVLAHLLEQCPVYVTGVGAFSAAGEDAAALWEMAVAGRSTAQQRQIGEGAGSGRYVVCAAPPVDLTRPDLRPVRKMDRCAVLAQVAAAEAWRHAQIEGVYAPQRIGVMVGSSRGPLGKTAQGSHLSGGESPMPSLAADTAFASISGVIARTFGCNGPGSMVSATCASAAFAVALAAEQIVLGHADAMLVGGAEAALHPALLAQMQATGVLGSHEDPERACRPFAADRNGIVLGEGSAFLVLESAETATARGAGVLARLAGWATRTDHSGRTGINPHGSGLIELMKQALEIAKISPAQIGYINAHGTGTKLNDSAEAQAVADTFDGKVPCTSTKPVTGHCLGATPALESVLCIGALRRRMIPPTANCHDQDPLCPINAVTLKAQPARAEMVMSNSLGFWGYQASLVFGAVHSQKPDS